jgi:proton-coupled amino acid transporter
VKKIGPLKTYFMLLKGFVCTGILYLPKEFYNGGWAFSGFAMIFSFILTSICAIKLLEAKKKSSGPQFTDIGMSAMGKPGKIMVDITLGVSQTGFVTAYIYFISANLQSVFLEAFHTDINIIWFGKYQ